MAKITDPFDQAEYLWRQAEHRLAEAVSRGLAPETAGQQRKAMWEKLHPQFGDREGFGQRGLAQLPKPGRLLQDELVKQNMEQARQASEQAAVRQAQLEHMQSAAMMCSITDGLNLWVARWGDGWVWVVDVQKTSTANPAFRWDVLKERLLRTHRMEGAGDYVRVVT